MARIHSSPPAHDVDAEQAEKALDAGREELRNALLDWARARAAEGKLVGSLRDADQILTIVGPTVPEDAIETSVWKEIENDAALDHLVFLCFADEPVGPTESALLGLLGDRDKTVLRLQARIDALHAGPQKEWPHWIFRAYDYLRTTPMPSEDSS